MRKNERNMKRATNWNAAREDEGVTVSMKTDDSCCANQPATEVDVRCDDGRLFFIFLLNAS